MKAVVPGLILLFVLGITLFLYWPGDSAPLPSLITSNPPKLRVDPAGIATMEPARNPVPPGSSTTGLEFRFVSAATGLAIKGGRIFDVHGEILGSTDQEGIVRISNSHLNALVFGADGYLTEHFFDRADKLGAMVRQHEQRGYVRIALELDGLTLPCQLRFVDTKQSLLSEVVFRVKSLATPAPSALTVPSVQVGAGSVRPELRAAWRRHVLLSTMRRPDFNPELLHFGTQSHTESYLCDGEAEMRFVAAGRYRVDARSGDLTGQQVIDVRAPAGAPITIRLGPGVFVVGKVSGAEDSKQIAGAVVIVSRDDQIVTSGETDKAGEFRVGPMTPAGVTLEIRHQNFAPFQQRGVVPGSGHGTFTLQPLPKHRVSGTVRSRPAGLAIRGAEVRLTSGLGVVAKGRTNAAGRFNVVSTLTEPTLEVLAEGFLDYAEMINANGEDVSVELIPDQTRTRQQTGLSAVITGRVLDDKQRPVPNCPVHVRPQTPRIPVGIPGRRIIRGAVIPTQSMVVTGADGTYRIEWARTEVVVLAAGRVRSEDQGRALSVALGKRHEANLRSH